MAIHFEFSSDGSTVSADCYRGLNLLAHAQLEEVLVGSRCGGHGICGKDRVRVQLDDFSKLSPPSATERKHLSLDEINAGWRLACQCFPSEDGLELRVSCPEGPR